MSMLMFMRLLKADQAQMSTPTLAEEGLKA